MTAHIAIIDYGQGNLRSVEAACRATGLVAEVINTPEDLWRASAAILPGVGAFKTAMDRLRMRGLADQIKPFASVRPLFGICLGMQLLTEGSEEGGDTEGLGVIRGNVVRLPASRPIPHVGWQEVSAHGPWGDIGWSDTPLEGSCPDERFYFCHGYNVRTTEAHWLASAPFGNDRYCAAVRSGHVFGVQFHPEKSGPAGLGVFRQFRRMVEQRRAA
jgi:glutamine amidotransferase